MTKKIEYLTFEGGGGKGIVYLGAIKALMILLIVLSLPSCNAQETKQDSIPKEFEFINVFLPKNLETITPDSLKKILIAKNIIVTEYPTKYEYTEIIPLVYQDHTDSIKSKLNDYYLVTNKVDSVKNFSTNAYYYFSENKDFLQSTRIEISDDFFSENRYDSNNEKTYQKLYVFLKAYLKEKYVNKLSSQIEYFDESKMDFEDEIIQSVFWNFKSSQRFVKLEFTKRKQKDGNWNNEITILIIYPLY